MSIEDGPGTNYTLHNSGYLHYAASAVDKESGDTIASGLLPARNVDLWQGIHDPPRVLELRGQDPATVVAVHTSPAMAMANAQLALKGIVSMILGPFGLPSTVANDIAGAVAGALLDDNLRMAIANGDEAAFRQGVDRALKAAIAQASLTALIYAVLATTSTAASTATAATLAFVFVSAGIIGGNFGPVVTEIPLLAALPSSLVICQDQGTFSECVDRVEITPREVNLLAGDNIQLNVQVVGVEGTDLTSTYTITWTSRRSDLATVDANGLVTANNQQREGPTWILAKAGGKVDSVRVAVISVSGTYDLVALNGQSLPVVLESGPDGFSELIGGTLMLARTGEFDLALTTRNSEPSGITTETVRVLGTHVPSQANGQITIGFVIQYAEFEIMSMSGRVDAGRLMLTVREESFSPQTLTFVKRSL